MENDIVVIDFETAGLTPDCVVYTFAAVRFNPGDPEALVNMNKPENQMYVYLSPREQLETYQRRVDTETRYGWWERQSTAAFKEIIVAETEDQSIGLRQWYQQLSDFLKPTDRVYARGQEFERDFIFDICQQLNVRFSRRFNQFYDVRTYLDCLLGVGLAPGGYVQSPDLISHHSLHDCLRDASLMWTTRWKQQDN